MCSVTDLAGSKVTGSFQVIDQGAATQVNNLKTTVNSVNLAGGTQTSLNAELQAVLADVQANQPAPANADLQSFINHVKALKAGRQVDVTADTTVAQRRCLHSGRTGF